MASLIQASLRLLLGKKNFNETFVITSIAIFVEIVISDIIGHLQH